MKAFLLVALLALTASARAQTVDEERIDSFAAAVARAEGFGVRRAVPTRYHNPGDIKSRPGVPTLPGQRAIGKGGHIVFRSDAYGWGALHELIHKMLDGRSRHFSPDMTVEEVARRYAQNWRPWARIVCAQLGAPPSARLGDVLAAGPDGPPLVAMPAAPPPSWLFDHPAAASIRGE